MLKKLLLLSLLCLAGCDANRPADNHIQYIIDRSAYTVQNFDGCEYLVSVKRTSIAHKGNCTNEVHKLILVLPIPVEVEKKREFSLK